MVPLDTRINALPTTGVPTSCSRGDASGVEAPRGGTGRLVSKGLPAPTAAPVFAAAASVKALKRPRVEADSDDRTPKPRTPLFTVFIYTGVCVWYARTHVK